MPMKVTINLDTCEASGRCYDYSDDVFEKGPQGKGVVKVADIPDDDWSLRASAEAAQNSCPTGAIRVEEDD